MNPLATSHGADSLSSPTPEYERLRRLASEIAKSAGMSNWKERIGRIRLALATNLGADGVLIYMLHLRNGKYQIQGDASDSTLHRLEKVGHELIARVQESHQIEWNHSRDVAIPVVRGANVVMIVVVGRPRAVSDWRELQAMLAPLGTIQLDRRCVRVLTQLRTEFDFRLPSKQFMNELGEAILDASGMQFAALRVVRGDRLDCEAAWGLGSPNLRRLSWPINKYPEFAHAAAGGISKIADLPASGSALAQTPELAHVVAFAAVPINIGSEIYGVLSVATSTKYEFAQVELNAFQSLANVVGLILRTYRSLSTQDTTLPKLSELSMKATLEVIASSARHEGRARIDNAQELTQLISKESDPGRRAAKLEKLQEIHADIKSVFDKYGMVLRPPRYDWRTESIRDVWRSAISQFSARLEYMKISYVSPPPDLVVPMYGEWVRAAFMQLIMNSLDAFNKRGAAKGHPAMKGRRIGLSVQDDGRKSGKVVLHYFDNAGGIAENQIKSSTIDQNLKVSERIFRPLASSKGGEGTGYGLPLARSVMLEHHGGIRLSDNGFRGVTFELEFPLDGESS
jgi:signal transduction histidine kinase